MHKVLMVTASPRYAGSHSRRMATEFLQLLGNQHFEFMVTERDLFAEAPPALSNAMIQGFFRQPANDPAQVKAELTLSDRYTAELMSADTVVVATPMYNFNVPAALKAWIDLVIRSGITFEKVADGKLEGRCQGKRLLVLCSMGGCFADTKFNLIEPYFRLITEFIGLDQVEFIYLQGTARSDLDRDSALESARQAMLDFIQQS